MYKKACPSLIFLLALVACSKPPATSEPGATEARASPAAAHASGGDTNTLSSANVMSCTIDDRTTVSGHGDGVGIASFGIKDNQLSLGLSVSEQKNGNDLGVGTGLFRFPMAPGNYESVGATYAIGNETSEKLYKTMMYPMFFATSSDDPLTRSEINIKKLEKGRAESGVMVRTHIVGDARFHAAYAPDPMSRACGQDGSKRVMDGLKYPMYNAAVCGAEKVKVECKFDLTADFVDLGAIPK